MGADRPAFGGSQNSLLAPRNSLLRFKQFAVLLYGLFQCKPLILRGKAWTRRAESAPISEIPCKFPVTHRSGPITILGGTGTPRREFLHVDDCADALVFLLRHYSDASTVNVGVGRDVTIAELASVVAGVVGYTGQIGFDPSRPDGTPRKLLDVSRLTAFGWQAHTG